MAGQSVICQWTRGSALSSPSIHLNLPVYLPNIQEGFLIHHRSLRRVSVKTLGLSCFNTLISSSLLPTINMAAAPEVTSDISDTESFQDSLTDQEELQNRQLQKKDDSKKPEEEPKQFRTVQQQQKYENSLKQQHREDNKQSTRSRSASRRARRKRIQEGIESGKYMKTTSLEALEEADANGSLNQMGMFERIGPDSTSMDGPVTHARAMRGEIPMRGTDPNQPYMMEPQGKKSGALEDQEGLKLTLEANLDIEIELKASIRGDLTLSLL
jgi:hypothetical protein